MRGLRLIGLAVGLVVGGMVAMLGLLLVVRVLLPEWYAVPGALLQMTGQRVPVATAPAEPVLVVDQLLPSAPATPATHSEPVDQTNTRPTPVPTVSAADVAPALPPQSDLASGPLLPGRRFNVLLLGSDNDLKFAANAVLTQAMILVSIDPTTHDVAMISIPRDFWVPIRGYGYQKIDVAYEVGGIGLARSTVESLFGVRIDYYAWVGLSGLVQVIDTLGGVDVTVQHPILDETYPDDLNTDDPYAYFRLYIPAGPQHLDGTTALQYVRSRHGDFLSDFGRSQRQQQVLVAIKNRVQTMSALTHVPRLVSALEGSIKTDLSVPAIVQLAALSRNVPANSIHQQVLAAPDFAWLGYSPDGTQQVVYPNWSAIRPAVARLLQSGGPTSGAVAAGQ
jgi:LCP family protein required for cell wall assembly